MQGAKFSKSIVVLDLSYFSAMWQRVDSQWKAFLPVADTDIAVVLKRLHCWALPEEGKVVYTLCSSGCVQFNQVWLPCVLQPINQLLYITSYFSTSQVFSILTVISHLIFPPVRFSILSFCLSLVNLFLSWTCCRHIFLQKIFGTRSV